MAVYTDISDEELAALLADFDLGQAISFKGVAEGVENSNFLLETETGRYFLTVYEKRVRTEDLPFFLGLMRWLAEHGFPCATPIARREGAGRAKRDSAASTLRASGTRSPRNASTAA